VSLYEIDGRILSFQRVVSRDQKIRCLYFQMWGGQNTLSLEKHELSLKETFNMEVRSFSRVMISIQYWTWKEYENILKYFKTTRNKIVGQWRLSWMKRPMSFLSISKNVTGTYRPLQAATSIYLRVISYHIHIILPLLLRYMTSEGVK
jgi:hypothetical protein